MNSDRITQWITFIILLGIAVLLLISSFTVKDPQNQPKLAILSIVFGVLALAVWSFMKQDKRTNN